jgi:hypothetical protein
LTEQSATRAEALLRIARLERRLNHPEAALAAYDRMSRETAISPDGVPYALMAAGARCELHDAVEAAEQLRAALLAGRWPLHRATFYYYWPEVNRTGHTARVFEQVADGAPQGFLIGLDGSRARIEVQFHLEAAGQRLFPKIRHGRAHHAKHIVRRDAILLAPGFHAPEIQQVLPQALQPAGLAAV